MRHCEITVFVIRPPLISTIASMSPCRDVPRPRYTPSLYDTAPLVAAAGGGAETGGAATGAGAVVGDAGGAAGGGVTEGVAEGATASDDVADTDDGAVTTATGSGTVAGGAPVGTCGDGGSAGLSVRPASAIDSTDPTTDAGIGCPGMGAVGNAAAPCCASPPCTAPRSADAIPAANRSAPRVRRLALCDAMRSAAGFVFAYPAVYTRRTAADPSATSVPRREVDTEARGSRLNAYRASAARLAFLELDILLPKHPLLFNHDHQRDPFLELQGTKLAHVVDARDFPRHLNTYATAEHHHAGQGLPRDDGILQVNGKRQPLFRDIQHLKRLGPNPKARSLRFRIDHPEMITLIFEGRVIVHGAEKGIAAPTPRTTRWGAGQTVGRTG